jgi:methionine-rich copper-binding protein CopC
VSTPVTPLAVTAPIVFEFNKDIDLTTVPATAYVLTTQGTVLVPKWEGTGTGFSSNKLTLTPAAYEANSKILRLPYNLAGGAGNATISFSFLPTDNPRATDGSPLFSETYHVYTAPSLSLKSWEPVTSTAVPARNVAIKAADAIKLTFSEAIDESPNAIKVGWGNLTTGLAPYKAAGDVLYVYPVGTAGTSIGKIYLQVTAANDASNRLLLDDSDADHPPLNVTFELEQALDVTHINGVAFSGTSLSSLPGDKDIVIEFNKELAKGSATLYYTLGTYRKSTISASVPTGENAVKSKILKVAPTGLLSAGTFELSIDVESADGSKVVKTITVGVIAVTGNPAKNTKTFGELTVNSQPGTGASSVTASYRAGGDLARSLSLTPEGKAFDGTWSSTAVSGGPFTINKGAPADTSVSIGFSSLGATPHTESENIQLRLVGADPQGYSIISSTLSLTFN